MSIPNNLAKTVKNDCSDMYDGFINATKEVFGSKVTLVIDRFHVAKNYRGAMETLRKKEMKRLKRELSVAEYKKLKNIMWILRKKEMNHSDEDKEILNLLFNYSPLLKKAYKFRNKLTEIFNESITSTQAKRKIKQWIKSVEKSRLTCFDTFIKTLRGRWNEILSYFITISIIITNFFITLSFHLIQIKTLFLTYKAEEVEKLPQKTLKLWNFILDDRYVRVAKETLI